MPNKKRKKQSNDDQSTKNKKPRNLEEGCKCTIHKEVSSKDYDVKFIVFNVKKRKDFSVKAFNFLKSRGFVSERASFVCSQRTC